MYGHPDLTEIFGEPIHVYTRAEALDDGMLVDVTEAARETGFRLPVALTAAAWADCVEWAKDDSRRQTYQDESGRLWDVLWLASLAARRARDGDHCRFQLYRVPRGGRGTRPRLTTVEMHIGPGDNGEPVCTIGLPSDF